jgi:hypothetical protein
MNIFLLHFLQVTLQLSLLFKNPLEILINFLTFFINFILNHKFIICILFSLQNIVIRVQVITTLQRVRMNNAELFIEDNPRTSLLAYLFIPIFGFHMFS